MLSANPTRAALGLAGERHGHGLRQGIATQSELRLNGTAPALPEIDEFDANQLEYRISDLSTGHQLIHFCRERLQKPRRAREQQAGRDPQQPEVKVAALVITRQAPSTAKRIRFFTLEDEFGQVNVTIKPDVYERYRQVANRQPILVIDGVMQRNDGVYSVLASHIEGFTACPGPSRNRTTTASQDLLSVAKQGPFEPKPMPIGPLPQH